jgi:hypothetical protein
VSSRDIPRTSDDQRAENFAARLTLPQLEAIASDTRLPGEIAGKYGVTAALMLGVQRVARRHQMLNQNYSEVSRVDE